jgi:hypothetical protein
MFPNNTTSNFTTHLPERLHLKGSWEASVVEFHYPQTINNVYSKNNVIYFDYDNGKKEKLHIEMGYSTFQEII